MYAIQLGGVTGYLGQRPLRPGPWGHPLGGGFQGWAGVGHSSRSAPGWLWTDLDEYASDAPVMHAVHVVLT